MRITDYNQGVTAEELLTNQGVTAEELLTIIKEWLQKNYWL